MTPLVKSSVIIEVNIIIKKKALRHSLWIRLSPVKDRIGFYENIHTKQRRARKNIYTGNNTTGIFV
jgi:hypothetical protein